MGVTPEKRLDAKFRRRLRRRLHYGDMADLDAPSLPLTELSVDYFHDSTPGKLGHVDLETASNIVKQNKVTPCSMVISVLYARRLRQRNRQYLDSMSSSDVFFISMMMASKYMYDEGTDDEVYNDEWAASVDQEVCDVNKMEMEFLQAMDWGLFVRPEEFEKTLDAIEKRLALKEGLKRGWFTYGELDVLMGPDLIGSVCCEIAAEVSKLLATLSAAYLTGLLSMLGSVALATQVSGPLSSATVALMALHSSPGMMSPLGEDPANLLPISGHRTRLCGHRGARDQCQGLVEIEDGNLVVEVDLQEMNRTDFMEIMAMEPPADMHGDLKKALVLDTGGGFRDIVTSDANEAVESNVNNAQKKGDENGGFSPQTRRPEEEEENFADSTLSFRPVTSSLWSLWFLDSLLSQIWSLSAFKSQPARKRPSPWLKRRRFTKSHHGDGILNVQDTIAFPGESFDDVCPPVCKSMSFRTKLTHGKARCCENCFMNHHSSSPTKKGQKDDACNRIKEEHYRTRSSTHQAMAEKDCSQKNIGEFCKGISLGSLSAQSSSVLSSPGYQANLHNKAQQDLHANFNPLSSAGATLGRVSDFPDYLEHGFCDLTCSGLVDSLDCKMCEHETPSDGTFFRTGDDRVNGCHQIYPTGGDKVGTQASIFNLPTSLFSGVYRMLQVA